MVTGIKKLKSTSAMEQNIHSNCKVFFKLVTLKKLSWEIIVQLGSSFFSFPARVVLPPFVTLNWKWGKKGVEKNKPYSRQHY